MSRHVIWSVLVLAACGSPYVRPPVSPEEPPDPPPPPAAARREGPLSLSADVPEPSGAARQQALRRNQTRYLGRDGLREDVAAFFAVVDTFYPARSDAQREAVRVAHQVDVLPRLAPYAVDVTAGGFFSAGAQLGLCVRLPNDRSRCDVSFQPKPAVPGPPFEITEPSPGVALVTIRDLSDAAVAGWADFPAARARLGQARALVLDLRLASGADPRPLVPWLEELTGRPGLAPLRAINRPASADGYVGAYAARFLTTSRDRAVWASLVGKPSSATRPATRQPIAIVVGRHCGAACELVARVLQTYASATVVGGVSPAGRLGRDEPARLLLPSSRVEVFFLATEYLLAPEIEVATGPSDRWALDDGADLDGLPFALREVQERLAGGAARCDAFPAYADAAALPPTVAARLIRASLLAQPAASLGCQLMVQITSDLPTSALRRYLRTCAAPIEVGGWTPGQFDVRGPASLAVLSQLAQSDRIQRITVTCVVPPQPT